MEQFFADANKLMNSQGNRKISEVYDFNNKINQLRDEFFVKKD